MQLWTPEHIKTLPPAIAGMLIIVFFLRHLLKNRGQKIRMIPFQILTCILLLLETGKQILSIVRGYDLYHIPLHFCSLFIFIYPAMSFYQGKHQQKIRSISAAISASVFLLMLIYPNLIYSADNVKSYFTDFFSFHTVTFHNLVMLGFLLIPALELYEPAPEEELKTITLFMIGFSIVAATMAQLLKTNYANFYSCNIPIFETLRTSLQPVIGSIMTQLLYVLCVAVLQEAFVIAAYLLFCSLHRSLTKNKSSKMHFQYR